MGSLFRSPSCCRWLVSVNGFPESNTPDAGSTAFGPCNGPTTTSSTNAVSNGYWLFQVRLGGN